MTKLCFARCSKPATTHCAESAITPSSSLCGPPARCGRPLKWLQWSKFHHERLPSSNDQGGSLHHENSLPVVASVVASAVDTAVGWRTDTRS